MRQMLTQQVAVVICRDCRGNGDQQSRTDTLRTFGNANPDTVELLTTDCLDRCDYADVIVIRPSPQGRHAGGRPTWFGFTDETAHHLLRDWVAAGGPGLATMPAGLTLHEISRPRGPAADTDPIRSSRAEPNPSRRSSHRDKPQANAGPAPPSPTRQSASHAQSTTLPPPPCSHPKPH